jgi:hypothetical protein
VTPIRVIGLHVSDVKRVRASCGGPSALGESLYSGPVRKKPDEDKGQLLVSRKVISVRNTRVGVEQ